MVMVMILCGCGALLRYALKPLNAYCLLPLGTLAANLLVALMIGYLSRSSLFSSNVQSWLIFFLGGLGTYSTFNLELIERRKSPRQLLFYLLLTYVLGVAGVVLGRSLVI